MYYGRRDQKTAAYCDWERAFLHELAKTEPQLALKELREAFDIAKNCYRMRITWHSPDLLTKDSKLSSRTFDVTNCEKIIVDLLTLPKFHVQGTHNLNIDDKYVMTLSSGKRCSTKDWEIRITIWLELLQKYL